MRQRAARAGAGLASHPVEVAFSLLVIVAFAYSLRITRESYFWVDEWPVMRLGGSVTRWLDGYNHSLSLVSLVVYRVLPEVFGLAYTPFRVVALLILFAVPSGYFLTTRRQFGAPLAALLALPLLWFGRYISFHPAELNHNLALLGAVGCGAALNRGRRADWVLAAVLTISLCSAGGGLAVSAACLVHNACTRPHVRRWLVVVIPTLLWIIWWGIFEGKAAELGPFAMTTSEKLLLVRNLGYSAFDSAALGNPVLAMGFAAAFVVYGIWAVSKGLNHGANFLAWSMGVVAWAVLLAAGRGVFADTESFRYRYFSLGLILLAVVPQRPIVWPARLPIASDRRWRLAAAVALLVLGSARGLAVRSDMQAYATQLAAIGTHTRAETLVIGLDRTAVPDDTVLPLQFGLMSAAQVRALLAEYGNPFPATRATADQQLVDMGIVGATAARRQEVACERLTEPFAFGSIPSDQLLLWSPDSPFAVEVRRFGDEWVPLDEARPGEALRLTLPRLGSAEPWQVRANGACRVGP